MALDHYVPQVHLRHWCLPDTGRLLAFRKADGRVFEPRTQDVCRIEDGNTNSYLKHDRSIEDFLREIEPKYNDAVEAIVGRDIPWGAIWAVAGFSACVYSCSQTGMRIWVPQLTNILEVTAEIADRHGKFDKPPAQLGGSSVTELLRSGRIKFKVDPKYPQAINITHVMETIRVFGNSAWELLINEHSDSPFLTSDFPFALEATDSPAQNRIVPLTPRLAVRILPRLEAGKDKEKYDLKFPGFRYRTRRPKRREIAYLNKLIAQCAESLVFCSGRLPWVEHFVRRNSLYKLDTRVRRIPADTGGTLLVATQCIVAHPPHSPSDNSFG
jgi:hypothetical protein